MSLAYFPWYVADAEADEKYRSMTDAEVGFFHRCLNHSWKNDGIPADPTARARALNRSRAVADRLWRAVGKCYTPSSKDPERLVNPRQEKERAKAVKKSESSAGAAKRRWDGISERTANGLPRAYDCGSDSDSDSDSSKGVQGETKKLAAPLPVPNQSDYPLTDAAIRGRFASADRVMVARIIRACLKEYLSIPAPRIPEPTDADLAAVIAEAVVPKQDSAGLFLKTAPKVIRTWAELGQPGRRYEPVLEDADPLPLADLPPEPDRREQRRRLEAMTGRRR